METTGDYIAETEEYTMIVNYRYYYEPPTHEMGAYRETEVKEVHLQSKDKHGVFVTTDITAFYWDFIEANLIEEIENEAHENLMG